MIFLAMLFKKLKKIPGIKEWWKKTKKENSIQQIKPVYEYIGYIDIYVNQLNNKLLAIFSVSSYNIRLKYLI